MAQLDTVAAAAKRDGVIAGPYSNDLKMPYVDYHDVAEAAALALTEDRFVNGTFELSSAGICIRVDIAEILSDLLKRQVRAQRSPPALPDSMPKALREGLTHTFDHYDRFGFHGGNSVVLAAMLGREPTSVVDYLSRAVAR